MADIEKNVGKKAVEEQESGIQIRQGNTDILTVQLLAAINKQLSIIINTLNKEK